MKFNTMINTKEFQSHVKGLYIFVIIIISGIVFGNACDDRTIDPFEEDEGTYSIYGVLEVNQNPNFIRVKDLNESFLPDSNAVLDAIVIFENTQNGNAQALQDSIIRFGNFLTHNFKVTQSITPSTEYRIEVTGANGEVVSSVANTPSITDASAIPGNDVNCMTSVTFSFKNVVRPEEVLMEVGFFYDGRLFWGSIGTVDDLEYRPGEDEMFVRMRPKDLLIEVFPPAGLADFITRGGDPRNFPADFLCDELDSDTVLVRYQHLSKEWENFQPDTDAGEFDPTTSLDVNNGLGFFGALLEDTLRFTVDTTGTE